ncbi:DUF6088 family protein [Vibrio alginolyticus]
MTATDRIYQKIKRSRRYVFERKDFDDYASYDQIGRVLKKLVDKGLLMKVGYGLYTKSTINSLTNKPMPTNPGGTDAIMREILKMRGVDFELDAISLKSLDGESTQIPASIRYKWNSKHFNRSLKIGNRVLNNRK